MAPMNHDDETPAESDPRLAREIFSRLTALLLQFGSRPVAAPIKLGRPPKARDTQKAPRRGERSPAYA